MSLEILIQSTCSVWNQRISHGRYLMTNIGCRFIRSHIRDNPDLMATTPVTLNEYLNSEVIKCI